ncbi:hypothetical protein CROQUDRAFT_655554 [Cronartium quercuum f. sp. fusiforme G11]|uniref:tRNA-splicing endonuclease subunit Sen2 n=1 Tax=Cronartium quercuum f. sp. fusiforme G11 TaxID=708437 RepID=A0A9P6NL39_9BASI|nr:hypothetical protein CROQUDRAFT_655554 [Cronartium quercuum f. sp. fusiforme G11]
MSSTNHRSTSNRFIPTITKIEPSQSKAKRVREPKIYNNLLPIKLYPTSSLGPLSFLRARICSFLSIIEPTLTTSGTTDTTTTDLEKKKSCLDYDGCQAKFDPISQAIMIDFDDHVQYLWRSGFFGKGSLSRSEPTWIQRAKNRHAISVLQSDHGLKLTAEELTAKRRIERREAKIEKAKEKERELKEQLKKVENLNETLDDDDDDDDDKVEDDSDRVKSTMVAVVESETWAEEEKVKSDKLDRPLEDQTASSVPSTTVVVRPKPGPLPATLVAELDAIVNLEHLQLKPVEAFFLAYGLGSLTVEVPREEKVEMEAEVDESVAKKVFSIDELWDLFCAGPSLIRSAERRPDNPFVVSYVAYHHFRSLGWVVRDGIKFCVDWVLYGSRGPVGGHAEFAVCVIPAYEDPEEEPQGLEADLSNGKRSWQWLSTVNRVCSGVKKTLVLAYVIIPSSKRCGAEEMRTANGCLKLYGVKEVVIKRFIPSRMRD